MHVESYIIIRSNLGNPRRSLFLRPPALFAYNAHVHRSLPTSLFDNAQKRFFYDLRHRFTVISES
jgi:hypothetical protein